MRKGKIQNSFRTLNLVMSISFLLLFTLRHISTCVVSKRRQKPGRPRFKAAQSYASFCTFVELDDDDHKIHDEAS
jgi:hypothetical protein